MATKRVSTNQSLPYYITERIYKILSSAAEKNARKLGAKNMVIKVHFFKCTMTY